MRAVLEAAPGGSPMVEVAADGVRGHGCWRGMALPAFGTTVEVEVDVLCEIDWLDVTVDGPAMTRPAIAGDGALVHGVVEGFHAGDRVLVLRAGDAILLVDTVGEAPQDVIGRTVSFVAAGVDVYPTGV